MDTLGNQECHNCGKKIGDIVKLKLPHKTVYLHICFDCEEVWLVYEPK